jgi:hypothetical protein
MIITMSLSTLPTELLVQVALNLHEDHDMCSLMLACWTTCNALRGSESGFWRRRFCQVYDMPPISASNRRVFLTYCWRQYIRKQSGKSQRLPYSVQVDPGVLNNGLNLCVSLLDGWSQVAACCSRALHADFGRVQPWSREQKSSCGQEAPTRPCTLPEGARATAQLPLGSRQACLPGRTFSRAAWHHLGESLQVRRITNGGIRA